MKKIKKHRKGGMTDPFIIRKQIDDLVKKRGWNRSGSGIIDNMISNGAATVGALAGGIPLALGLAFNALRKGKGKKRRGGGGSMIGLVDPPTYGVPFY
jgi:hypothetical protein